MKMKRRSIVCAGLIVCLLGAFFLLRWTSGNRTFGLSAEAMQNPSSLTAEETVRLYLRHLNRHEYEQAELLTTDNCEAYTKAFFQDINLISIENIPSAETATEAAFNVLYNEDPLWATTTKNEATFDFQFDVVKVDGVWKIDRFGNG